MTHFQSRALAKVYESFGFGLFTLFDIASVTGTTIGNIQGTVVKLVKQGYVVDQGNGFYSVNA